MDEAAKESKNPGAHAAAHGQLIVGMDASKASAPADEVVGEHGAGEPGRVGEEVVRWTVFEAGTSFDVTDGEFDAGMGTVESVGGHGVEFEIGDEGAVAPVGPQRPTGADR